MTDTRTTTQTPATRSPDLLIIGGGIVGLWCAARASDAGLKTLLVDKGRLGQGSSGGFLGALMPHQPVRWTTEKQYQLEALLALETEIAALEETTGIDCGYLRCGRIIPTQTEKKRAERLEWREAAKQNWPAFSTTGQALAWNVNEQPPDGTWAELFSHRGRWYAPRLILRRHYARHHTPRSPRWQTVQLPRAPFTRLSRPFTPSPPSTTRHRTPMNPVHR